MRQVFIRRTS